MIFKKYFTFYLPFIFILLNLFSCVWMVYGICVRAPHACLVLKEAKRCQIPMTVLCRWLSIEPRTSGKTASILNHEPSLQAP